MRVAMMGSGGLGAFFGGLQARAGLEVTFIARGKNLEALRANGLTVQLLPEGELHLDVRATDDPRSVGPVDLVWFCVKTYDLDAAARQAAPLIGSETLVLPLQNGVDAADQIAAVVGEGPVLGGVSLGGATLVAPGVVAQKVARTTVRFGELVGGSSPRTERLLGSLRRAGVEAELSPDIRVAIWEKFVVASVLLGFSALVRLPVAQMLACPETAELALGGMQETEAVGRAEGVRLPEGTAARLFEQLRGAVKGSPTARGSMYFDLVEGRRLELEAMNGAVVRLGRKHGIPTPVSFAVYAALKPYADGPPAPP